MASLSREKNGTYRIQFVDCHNKRRSVRLGAIPKKAAESVKTKVESLAALAVARLPMDHETATWVGGIGDDLAGKLAAVGLIPERAKPLTLAELVERHNAESVREVKGGTVVMRRVTTADLLAHFGPDSDPRAVTPQLARGFVAFLLTRDLASMTTSRRVRRARSVFAFGVRAKLLTDNPFTGLGIAGVLPAERKAYVTAADAMKLIGASPPAWRVVIALCRYGGLRCPSEVLSLKWADVNFAAGRMTVPSPKTEGTAGKEYRVCPIFSALRPHLEEAFELAPVGAVHVVSGPQADHHRLAVQGPNGWANANMRTTFERIIRRAGLNVWPRVFHTLRASCETDLLEEYPISAVTEWLGHSAAVALKHYTRVPDHLFDRAAGAVPVQNAVQQGAEPGGMEGKGEGATPAKGPDFPVHSAQRSRILVGGLVQGGPERLPPPRGVRAGRRHLADRV